MSVSDNTVDVESRKHDVKHPNGAEEQRGRPARGRPAAELAARAAHTQEAPQEQHAKQDERADEEDHVHELQVARIHPKDGAPRAVHTCGQQPRHADPEIYVDRLWASVRKMCDKSIIFRGHTNQRP